MANYGGYNPWGTWGQTFGQVFGAVQQARGNERQNRLMALQEKRAADEEQQRGLVMDARDAAARRGDTELLRMVAPQEAAQYDERNERIVGQQAAAKKEREVAFARMMQQYQRAPDELKTRMQPLITRQAEKWGLGVPNYTDSAARVPLAEAVYGLPSAKDESSKIKSAAVDTTTGLRKEFQALPVYKEFQTVKTAAEKIRKSSATGPGDISLVYGYMKLVDPNTGVKEGEYATAEQAGGVPARIVGLYNKIVGGQRLTPDVRSQFRAEANNLLGVHRSQFDVAAKQYRSIAEEAGVKPEFVVLPTDIDEDQTNDADIAKLNELGRKYLGQGLSKEEAKAAALREYGGTQ